MMQGVILAAGRGTRMGGMDMPKCLLKIGNLSLIQYQLSCFRQLGIDDVMIITGYNEHMIKEHLVTERLDIKYEFNENFDSTNNLYSLFKAKNFVKDDFICLHADLLFHRKILKKCYEHAADICSVVEKNTRSETLRVKIENGKILQINKTMSINSADGNFIGMVKFQKAIHKALFDEMSEYIEQENRDAYFVAAIEKMIEHGISVEFIETENLPWIDIDEKAEFESAKKTFSTLVT
jgi:choline kinase